MHDPWIWLPQAVYPQHQTTKYDTLVDYSSETFVVAEFRKDYAFPKTAASVEARFSADTEVQLFCNDKLVATGPSAVGGDFLGNGKVRQWYYADETTFSVNSPNLTFFARVKMCPTRIYEYSKGHGGFFLSARVTFTDGSTLVIHTDETWLVRKNGAYAAPCRYDGRIQPDSFLPAQFTPDIWCAQPAPIPVRTEQEIHLGTITLKAEETKTQFFNLDRIYAGFLHLTAQYGTVHVEAAFRETDETPRMEHAVLCGKDAYRSFHLQSAGNMTLTARNDSGEDAVIALGFITTCYPVTEEARTVTDDESINQILEVCSHTLKYCRQTHHLDSPRHCEPLACTGDYYIESLMTACSFGDMRLAAFDVERTAQLLRHNDGRMFHTSYSLIWVRMLHDVYMLTGNTGLLHSCRDALDQLLARFETYLGENGLIETPPDYMFVDWIYIDGISMHHPPKALGQTVLNMFYYMALDYAQRIYAVVEDIPASERCGKQKAALREAVNSRLYDPERGMYFEGLNTPTAPDLIDEYHPRNVEKRYYLKHSNILAAYTSICDSDTARMLIQKIMDDEIEGDVQPYFLHYLLEAVFEQGLQDQYTMRIINRWKEPVSQCPKGLVEGFIAPEPGYSFDHSHAWGGTPLYALPRALTGLTVLEPGYRKIRLNPSLLGFGRARVEIPTPFGRILCSMEQGQKPRISVPQGITVI